MSDDGNVKLMAIKCPTCAGMVELQVGRNKGMCPFCGNEVIIDDPGWLGELDKLELKLKNAGAALENKEWVRAEGIYEECIKINDSDPRGWQGAIEAGTKGLNPELSIKTEGKFRCFTKRSPAGVNDAFVGRYRTYLEGVASSEASKAVGNARDNIEYFKRMIESNRDSIADREKEIQDIKATPSIEIAEEKYGSAKTRLIVDTVLLGLAPVAFLGFIALFIILVVRAVSGNVHIFGMIASILAALIFTGVTRYVWKHYRQAIRTFKSRRIEKLGEDDRNKKRAEHNEQLINNRSERITEHNDNIEELERGIRELNDYINIDRAQRIDMFLKQHLDDAGLPNDIVIDETLTKLAETEKVYKRRYVGYKLVTSSSAFL
ncbi:MAG: hypothetical protein IJ757_03200 [Clostridiales bacterium]|nr:hypothetical protein [Clostridiales bacterium]